MAKLKSKKVLKTDEQPVIEPKAVDEEVEVEEKVMSNVVSPRATATYSIKVDNKKFENRTLDQVHSILHGVMGAVKRVVIEQE